MSKKILVVDGHNVIFRCEKLRQLKEIAPEKLIDLLNRAAFLDFDEIYVFFDASERFREQYVSGRVKVFKCRKGETADSAIIGFLKTLSKPYSARVVSDDYVVQQGTVAARQLRMTVREFFSELENGILKLKKHVGPSKLRRSLSEEQLKQLENLYFNLIKNKNER